MPEKKAENNKLHPAKPFLKWAGSKRQLLNHFNKLYPQKLKEGAIQNYYEPFLGSGAVFFDIAQRYQIEHACLCDVNEDLVLTYKMVQLHVSALTAALYQHQEKYLPLDKAARLTYFYDQRTRFNMQRFDKGIDKNIRKQIARAARLIFLNRTCFNGLFRVNAKGAFNTPAGDYIKPAICDEQNLLAVSGLLKNVTIKKADFTNVLEAVKPASFVYFDPPYRPLSRSASFTAYSKSAFTDVQQAKLAEVYKELSKKGAAVMLSNSDTNDLFFDNLYQGFHITRVPAKRLINADATKRGTVNEIVVTNYQV